MSGSETGACEQCFRHFVQVNTVPLADYQATSRENNYKASQGTVVQIKEFRVTPDYVFAGSTVNRFIEYYILHPSERRIKIRERYEIYMLDPKTKEYQRVDSSDPSLRMVKPGTRGEYSTFEVPLEAKPGTYKLVLQVECEGQQASKQVDLIVKDAQTALGGSAIGAAIGDFFGGLLGGVVGYASSDMPAFPWPPPEASAKQVIPNSYFHSVNSTSKRMAYVDAQINRALDASGYYERSYYSVPEGFVLVTRLEQIDSDGTPKRGEERWAVDVRPLGRSFSLSDYLRALFTSNPGYFRIVVFIITSRSFGESDQSIDSKQAIKWLHQGMNILPPKIGEQQYTDRHYCTALIYEFEKIKSESTARTLVPGRLLGRVHLEKAGIWEGLRQ